MQASEVAKMINDYVEKNGDFPLVMEARLMDETFLSTVENLRLTQMPVSPFSKTETKTVIQIGWQT